VGRPLEEGRGSGEEREQVNATDKVFGILETFLEGEKELKLSDLAKRNGLNISTAYVVASALVKKGYLFQREKRGKYSLGLKFLQFADAVSRSLSIRSVALPVMEKLRSDVDENVVLMVRDGRVAVVIAGVETDHFLTIGGKWMAMAPLGSAAGGKVLAAHMVPSEWEQLRPTLELQKLTANTIVDWGALEAQLEQVRREGVAVDDEETGMGVRGVAAPVRDRSGKVVASLDVIGVKMRMRDDKMDDIKRAVKARALEVSQALGYVDA
jgi:DNA-binding IclR family transcriptional regulator